MIKNIFFDLYIIYCGIFAVVFLILVNVPYLILNTLLWSFIATVVHIILDLAFHIINVD